MREAKEEVGLDVSGEVKLIGVYSEPNRDPRNRIVSAAYIYIIDEKEKRGLRAGDDAKIYRSSERESPWLVEKGNFLAAKK